MNVKEEGTLDEHVRCVITDIEMPIMDGHRLTKLIKSDDATKNIPVIIFSSLVNEDMKKKGESLGADAQLSKPEIGNLVRVIDSLVHTSNGAGMENSQPILCYSDEENARIYAVHLTAANQSEIRRTYLVSVMESFNQSVS